VIDIALFVEDDAQRSLVSGLVERKAEMEHVEVSIHQRSVEGGAGRALKRLKTFAADLRAGLTFADILVICIDADNFGTRQRRRDIKAALGGYNGLVVMAVPDPHIEKWYLLDPRAVSRSLRRDYPASPPPKGSRSYKRALLDAFLLADVRPPSGGSEFGEDIAAVMDLSLARSDQDFARFMDDLRTTMRLAASSRRDATAEPDGT
jgi:hypothetical protein